MLRGGTVAGDGCGNAIAVCWSTLLVSLMLFVHSVLEREIKAASAFRRDGLAMLFRTWLCYSVALRSKSH